MKRFLWAVPLVAVATACTAVLGDFDVSEAPTTLDGGGDGDAGPLPEAAVDADADATASACGALGQPCCGATCSAAGTACDGASGRCACASGRLACGGACVDPTSDPHHCGACDHDCERGACVSSDGGAPRCTPYALAAVPLGTGQAAPTITRVDGKYVYWAVRSFDTCAYVGGVYKIAKDGSATAPTTIAAQQNPNGLAIAPNGDVFWSNTGTCNGAHNTDGEVVSCAAAGCAQPSVVAANQSIAGAVAIFGSRVAWESTSNTCCSYTFWLREADPNGANVVTRETLTNQGGGEGISDVVADAHGLFWLDRQVAIRTASGASGAVDVLKLSTLALGFALDPIHLLWTEGGTLYSCSRANCTRAPIGGAPGSPTIATDGTNVVWTSDGNDTVYSSPIATPSPTTLATGQPGASGVSTDGPAVYWTTKDGTIWKLVR